MLHVRISAMANHCFDLMVLFFVLWSIVKPRVYYTALMFKRTICSSTVMNSKGFSHDVWILIMG